MARSPRRCSTAPRILRCTCRPTSRPRCHARREAMGRFRGVSRPATLGTRCGWSARSAKLTNLARRQSHALRAFPLSSSKTPSSTLSGAVDFGRNDRWRDRRASWSVRRAGLHDGDRRNGWRNRRERLYGRRWRCVDRRHAGCDADASAGRLLRTLWDGLQDRRPDELHTVEPSEPDFVVGCVVE